MSDDHPLLTTDTLWSFFYERVSGARALRGAALDEHTEFYLVNLLIEFLHTGQLVESGGRRVDDLPVAIRLLEADAASPGDRYRELKHLADRTLYVLGWFAESLARGAVDCAYYASLGEAAYGRLATLPSRPRRAFEDPVFRELSAKFDEAVSIIGEVRDEGLAAAGDVMALYDAWLQTGSERAAERLRELGVLLGDAKPPGGRILH